ncbi:hypothetical protein TRFO_37995 [Tritrichomonas foetus]|uniref:Uncharacterized protein n=1 Tax=Tritrichomonas foetus TaxID=1144522 RepID=A0A1J4J9H2_9EUKA|nr:hypothetical protein TRFO_37995 [Tritrichomonas foetus]|eukprot:OHS95842.1 hypothetical protein TRFO_37995 [Tritrichomonas foetus]
MVKFFTMPEDFSFYSEETNNASGEAPNNNINYAPDNNFTYSPNNNLSKVRRIMNYMYSKLGSFRKIYEKSSIDFQSPKIYDLPETENIPKIDILQKENLIQEAIDTTGIDETSEINQYYSESSSVFEQPNPSENISRNPLQDISESPEIRAQFNEEAAYLNDPIKGEAQFNEESEEQIVSSEQSEQTQTQEILESADNPSLSTKEKIWNYAVKTIRHAGPCAIAVLSSYWIHRKLSAQSPQEATQETKLETAQETKLETAQETKLETAQETKLETAQETKLETAQETKLETAQETKLETAQETKLETAQETKLETAQEIKLETAQVDSSESSVDIHVEQQAIFEGYVVLNNEEEISMEDVNDQYWNNETNNFEAEKETIELEETPSQSSPNTKGSVSSIISSVIVSFRNWFSRGSSKNQNCDTLSEQPNNQISDSEQACHVPYHKQIFSRIYNEENQERAAKIIRSGATFVNNTNNIINHQMDKVGPNTKALIKMIAYRKFGFFIIIAKSAAELLNYVSEMTNNPHTGE